MINPFIPPPDASPGSHLLVLALLRGELLQDAALPNALEVLPQGALARGGHGAAPGGPGPGQGAGLTGRPVRGEVHAGFADVPADGLAPDLLGDDGGAVRLVQRLWGWGGGLFSISTAIFLPFF